MQTDSLYPSFENRKDSFIQKYQILLEHQEMLEKRISGKIAVKPSHNQSMKALTYSQSEQQLEPYSTIEGNSELQAIEETEIGSMTKKAKQLKNESYIEKINRENKEYQDTLKHYFDNYFSKSNPWQQSQDTRNLNGATIEQKHTEDEIIRNEFPSLFKTSRLRRDEL